jgi:hypothetical protein
MTLFSEDCVTNIITEAHIRISTRLRSKVLFQQMDKDVEAMVKTCSACQMEAILEPPESIKRNVLPMWLQEYTATDFSGLPPTGKVILSAVDYYSCDFKVYVHVVN